MTDRNRGVLFCATAAFYSVLLVNSQIQPFFLSEHGRGILSALGMIFWLATLVGFTQTSFSDWVLTFLALIPFEFSHPFWRLPALSPIDYLGGAAMLALLLKSDVKTLWNQIISTFDPLTLSAWIAFFVYVLFSSFWLHGSPRRDFRWVLFLFVFFVASLAFHEKNSSKLISNAIRLISVLGAFIGGLSIIQFLTQGMAYKNVTATFGQHNSVGVFLSLCLPISVSWLCTNKKASLKAPGILVLLCLGGLLASYSRGAWIGLITGTFLIFGISKLRNLRPQKLGAVIILCILGSLLALHFLRHDLNGRNLYWETGIHILRIHPFVGLGPGNYASHVYSYLTDSSARIYREDLQFNQQIAFWLNLHNLYLQVLVEHGFIGAALFFFALWRIVRIAFGAMTTSLASFCRISIIGFLVHNFFDIAAVNSFDLLFGVLIAMSHANVNDQ